MSKIKIGQIGICHEHAGAKMDSLRLLSDVYEVVGVVDDRATRAARFAGDHLVPYEGLTWMTEEELLAVPGLQAVTIEVPNTDLVPTALRCMERNLPMHLDKPGGEDALLFKQLLTGCRERQLPLQMGYMFRNNPAMQFCLETVRENRLGEIFEVQASMSHNYGGELYQEYIGNFRGGILFNLGCHFIDFIVALLGRPENVSSFLKSVPGVDDKIKNNGLAILEYPQATVTLRACSREVEGLDRRQLKICGTKGTLLLSPLERFDGKPLSLEITLLEDDGTHTTRTVDFGIRRDRYEHQLLEFARMLRGEINNPYSYKHDGEVQDVVLAASGYTTWKK